MVLQLNRQFLQNYLKFHSKKIHSVTSSVRIVEVGPRDGLQNEPINVPTEVKIEFINRLSNTGLKTIETTSFVSPKWVPQMGDNTKVFKGITKKDNIAYPVLVPNLQGLDLAIAAGVKEIAVFSSATEGFCRKNTNCSIEEQNIKTKNVIDAALKVNLKVRGYVSCVMGCPYDGKVHPSAVTKMVEFLLSNGCYEVSLGDTIGVGTITTTRAMMKDLIKIFSPEKLAIHYHDTYGQALVNILTSMEYGVSVIDSSVSGLGGCPYAKGATGNVATEDLVHMLHGMGVTTGVDLKQLIAAGRYITNYLKKETDSKVNKGMYSKYFD